MFLQEEQHQEAFLAEKKKKMRMKIKQCTSQTWKFWKWLIQESCQECLAVTRWLVWVSDWILEIQVEGQSLSFRPDLTLNLRPQPTSRWNWAFQGHWDNALFLAVSWPVEEADLSPFSSLHPQTIEAASPVLVGLQLNVSTFLEYIHVWVVIQFIHIHVQSTSCLLFQLTMYCFMMLHI